MPALLVALALTFTRSAWVGVCAGIGAAVPAEGLPAAGADSDRRRGGCSRLAPPTSPTRVVLDLRPERPDQPRPRRDARRRASRWSRDHPLTGVGPNMVERRLPEYRDPDAVQPINPHLHNVPMQIAAERGLPALALWLVVRRSCCAVGSSALLRKRASDASLAAAALARAWRRCSPPAVRVQLRRFGVPDAVPGPHHAAVCRRPRRRACRMTLGRQLPSAPPAARAAI